MGDTGVTTRKRLWPSHKNFGTQDAVVIPELLPNMPDRQGSYSILEYTCIWFSSMKSRNPWRGFVSIPNCNTNKTWQTLGWKFVRRNREATIWKGFKDLSEIHTID